MLPSGDVFCYCSVSVMCFCSETHHLGVGFLVHGAIAENVVEFSSNNERVASVVIRLNKKHKLPQVRAYAPTSAYDDEVVDVFYEDMELAINKVKTPYSIIIDDLKAKIGAQQLGEHAVETLRLGSRNSREEMLIAFVEKNSLRIRNTFFRKRKNRKWT